MRDKYGVDFQDDGASFRVRRERELSALPRPRLIWTVPLGMCVAAFAILALGFMYAFGSYVIDKITG